MAPTPGHGAYRLAKRILGIVQEAGMDAGHHLREQQLADMLGVSRSPVRAALVLLQTHGVIEARRNQGFFLLRSAGDLQRFSLDEPVAGDQALYDQMVRDRLAGTVPASLQQTDIARRYQVDRVTMMRALARLAEDGLIVKNKGRGWTFLPSFDTDNALKSSYDLRITIEPAGLLLSTFSADRAMIERCRNEHIYLLTHPSLDSVALAHLFETDANFHRMLAEFSGNVFFQQSIQQQNRLRRLLEFGSYGNRRRIRQWCGEHLAILDAIVDGDMTVAADLLRQHLSRAHNLTRLAARQ